MYLLCTNQCRTAVLKASQGGRVVFICSSLTFGKCASESILSDLRAMAWMWSIRLAWWCSGLIFILWKTMSRILQKSAPTCRLEGGRCPLTDCGLDWGDELLRWSFTAQDRRGLWTKVDIARAVVKIILLQVTSKTGVTTRCKWKARPDI